MKIAIYARVSTDKCEVCGRKPAAHDRDDHEFKGQDPEVQLRELIEWCKRKGYKVVAQYVDRGLSGKIAARPELLRLFTDIERGRRDVDVVLVWKLTRFGRSVVDLVSNVNRLKAAGVSFRSHSEGFDLRTSTGKLTFHILCGVAEFELDVISENTKAGMKLARAKGHIPGPKIDPKRGPCRMTVWRQQQRKKTA